MALVIKLAGLLSLGIAVFGVSYHYNKIFLDWLRFQSIGTRDYIVERLNVMFIEVPPNQILLGLFLLSFGLGSIVFVLFLPKLFPGIPFAILVTIVGWKLPKPIVDFMYNRRCKKFILQMVDGLSLMSNGLKSGLSIVQSLSLVTQEMGNPIQQEFNLILNENKVGVPLEEAFNNLATRVKSDDVEMFVTSVNILKETGGNLAETFDTIVTTIRERIKLESKIASMTAQGFYSGIIVLGIPPLLAIYLSAVDPEFINPLFTTSIGWAIIFAILCLEVVGAFLIMKIIKIDV